MSSDDPSVPTSASDAGTADFSPDNRSSEHQALGHPSLKHHSLEHDGRPEFSLDNGRRVPSPRAILWAVGFSVFVAADDLTVVSTMLRPIIGDLGIVLPDGLDDAAWIVNAYLIAFIAIMPVAGRVSDVIGRRRTFMLAYATFMVGTIWIPLADSLGPLLVGRILTAIGGGAMVPVALAVVGDVYPEAKRARALGTLGAIETLGWVWGPLYGAMLVRFLSWRWQFWLNVPLAIVGAAAVWWALAEHDARARRAQHVDWLGAGLLTTALVTLNLALLGSAEVQSVRGLDELTGNNSTDYRLLYPVALVSSVGFVWQQRRLRATGRDPLIDSRLFRGRNVRVALIVNFLVGAGLVIAMVDVPLFVNAVEVNVERSAVVAGWILSALTAAMAVASYIGGRITERTWYGPPIIVGLVAATLAYGLMGFTWGGDTPYPLLAAQLGLLGAGIGLTVAPTTSAVVDHAEPDSRGAAAAVVMVVRMSGLSVGLSALTAWGLARFNSLRGDLDLPPLTDPDFTSAVQKATETLTAQSIADTFLASAAALGVGLLLCLLLLRRTTSVAVPSIDDRHTDQSHTDQSHNDQSHNDQSHNDQSHNDQSHNDQSHNDQSHNDETRADTALRSATADHTKEVSMTTDRNSDSTDSSATVDDAGEPVDDPWAIAGPTDHEALADDVLDDAEAVLDADAVDSDDDARGGAPDDPAHDDELSGGLADASGEPVHDTDEMPVLALGQYPDVDSELESHDDDAAPVGAPGASGWVHRHLLAVVATFAFLILGALVALALMIASLGSTRSDLDAAEVELAAAQSDLETTRTDLERVEAGAAIFASQVNGFVETINDLGPSIDEGLDQAVTGLEEFGGSTIEFTVNIDEQISIDQDFAIDRTVQVPIKTSIPINEEFDTTITVDGPFGLDIPVDITVPIDIDVPIDLTVDIPINETIPIKVDVPVKLDVPISIDVEGTELQALTASLIEGLRAFQDGLNGLTGN